MLFSFSWTWHLHQRTVHHRTFLFSRVKGLVIFSGIFLLFKFPLWIVHFCTRFALMGVLTFFLFGLQRCKICTRSCGGSGRRVEFVLWEFEFVVARRIMNNRRAEVFSKGGPHGMLFSIVARRFVASPWVSCRGTFLATNFDYTPFVFVRLPQNGYNSNLLAR